jgi:ankyrin repeat protein
MPPHHYDDESRPTRKELMAHFFYSFRGGKAETSHQGMLRSVLYQLLHQDHSLYPLFRSHYRQLRDQSGDKHWSLPLLLEILQSLGTIDKELAVHIILDAMDESDDEELPQILQAMVNLCSTQGRSIFKALMTTRPLRAKVSGQRMKQLTPLVLALEEKNQQAISRMVDKEIKQIIDDVLQEDESTDVNVFDGIKQYIKGHADGVFLWVSMVLKEVKSLSEEGWTQKNLEELKVILPPELGDVYKRMTKRIAGNVGPQALEQGKRILRPAVFSMRRLTIEEARDAIIVPIMADVAHFKPDPAYFKTRIQLLQRRIPMVCGDLVEVKPPFIQLIHESVREFLLDSTKVAAPLHMNDTGDRNEQTAVCIRYLRLSLSRSMLAHAGVNTADTSSWSDDDYMTFLQLLDDRPFLDYCLSYLPQHLLTADSDGIRDELNALIEDTKDVTPAIYLLMNTNVIPATLSMELESQRHSAQTFGARALLIAAAKGLVRAIRPLVTAGANVSQLESSKGTSPLMEATVAGHERVVQLLLDLDADVDTVDVDGETALHKAARLGQASIAELLVKHGAALSVGNTLRETPLHLGVRFGHLDIARAIVRRKWLHLANLLDKYGAAPLHGAVANGHLEIAGFLLEMGAYANTDAPYTGTPLHIAVDKADTKMAELLLRQGADTNLVGEYGATPLHSAASEGHEEMVRLLLDGGAKRTVPDRYGWLPIHWAYENGHAKVISMLLAEKGDKDDGAAEDKSPGSSVLPAWDSKLLFL